MDHDRDTAAPNLAPNVPLFVGSLTVAAAATQGRLIIPTPKGAFTEGYLVTITNRPTDEAGADTVAQFLINHPAPAGAAFNALPNAELLAPLCSHRQVVPGWLTEINVDVRGVLQTAYGTQADVTVNVVVTRMDRCTREDFKGQQ